MAKDKANRFLDYIYNVAKRCGNLFLDFIYIDWQKDVENRFEKLYIYI